MKKLIALLLTVAISAACIPMLTACSTGKKVAALIALHGESSTYDKNFIDAFKTAAKNKGLTEKDYVIVTDIPEGEECYNKAADFAADGYKAVFADSFGHGSYMAKAAAQYPNTEFYHATGTGTSVDCPANFHNAFASIYEGRYLAGYAAGLLLNTMKDKAVNNNFKVGYVGAYTYAEVISGYTSWYLGLCSALDEGYTATMDVQFTGSWYDEAGEKSAAETLINGGCVLLSQHADSMGAPTACENAGIPDVTYNGSTGKTTMVAYSKINWVPYFELIIDAALGGAKVVKDYTGTIESGSVVWALGTKIAEGTEAKVKAVEAELKAGTRKVFDCSTFTVDGQHITEYLADVQDDGKYTGDTNVIKTEGGVTYFSESTFRSAPYFDLWIDGINLLNTNFGEE